MFKKEIKELTLENFKIYGEFVDMLNPKGVKIGAGDIEFFRDMTQMTLGQSNAVSFSLCKLLKRDFIVETSEYHNYCGETVIPLDGDILMHVGPATHTSEFPAEDVEIFRVPKGTLVNLHPGVWHQAAFTYKCDLVNILVVLPERTYMTDCHYFELPEEKRIQIVGAE